MGSPFPKLLGCLVPWHDFIASEARVPIVRSACPRRERSARYTHLVPLEPLPCRRGLDSFFQRPCLPAGCKDASNTWSRRHFQFMSVLMLSMVSVQVCLRSCAKRRRPRFSKLSALARRLNSWDVLQARGKQQCDD